MSGRSLGNQGGGGGQLRSVLSEEEYTSTLSSIVRRDFFPDLPNLERQVALLEKRSQGDLAGAVAIRRATRKLTQHDEAVAAQEEEDEHDLESDNSRKKPRPLHQESITGFHTRVTNEDDAEFDSNQRKEIQENRERLDALFLPNREEKPLLTDMASDDFQPEPNRITATEWQQPRVRNTFFSNPTPLRIENGTSGVQKPVSGQLLISKGREETDDTSQQLTAMPPPKVREVDTTTSSKKAVPKNALVEYVPKHMLEKKIVPSQTRFNDSQSRIIPFMQHPRSRNSEASETDGSTTDASTDLDAPMRSIEQERRKFQKKYDTNKGSYVTMTPLIVAGGGDESPLTTWGTVDSTPLVLSGGDHMGEASERDAFAVQSSNKRELAARKAENSLAHRAKRAKTPKSTRRSNIPSSTPSVLSRKTKSRTPSRSRDSFASALRGSYTPKIRSRASSYSRKADSAYKATPLITKQHSSSR